MFDLKLEFRYPQLDDKFTFQKIMSVNNDINSESAFGTSYIWSDVYDLKICIKDDIIFKMVSDGFKGYEFPKGTRNFDKLKEAVLLLKRDFEERGVKEFKFSELLESEVDILEKIFPSKFSYVSNRDEFEYIYDISDLANLSGKKYHSKRNHISKFDKLYNWEYLSISELNLKECLSFFEKWFKINTKEKSLETIPEYNALKKAISNYKSLEFIGGMIKINGEIIASTIGERIGESTLLVHFEKALPEFEGSYSVINHEFCKKHEHQYKLVNREEDLGIPGLRKSKLSYKPKILLKKYNAKWED